MKVKTGKLYVFQASFWDELDRHAYTPHNGQLVRVVKLPGCPPPNTMGHCHVETPGGQFLGLVSTASLSQAIPLKTHLENKFKTATAN